MTSREIARVLRGRRLLCGPCQERLRLRAKLLRAKRVKAIEPARRNTRRGLHAARERFADAALVRQAEPLLQSWGASRVARSLGISPPTLIARLREAGWSCHGKTWSKARRT